MKFFSKTEIEKALDYPSLIEKLEDAFQQNYEIPQRLHYNYESGMGQDASTMLLMPAWKNEKYVGLKVISVSPYNSEKNQATIQGVYVLMNAKDGQLLALYDAKSLTNLRTAASSALASKYLSKKYAKSLFMIGTGALAPELIKAHCAVRPIEKVAVWGRNFEKARKVSDELGLNGVQVFPVKNIKDFVSKAEIISTATSSPAPLVFGNQLVRGQHLDLVGAFKPTWREADEEVIINSSVFADTRKGALKESGELLMPMGKGLFAPEDIKADLFDLCNKQHAGRSYDEEKTVFISVGYALEDLAAAELVWEKYIMEK
ncbi:MAG: ornithine cyclodeaminase family protein [Cytophagales bacterium]|nr:ornithine cyclodeaminase family protein [Cytophagales bacterium]